MQFLVEAVAGFARRRGDGPLVSSLGVGVHARAAILTPVTAGGPIFVAVLVGLTSGLYPAMTGGGPGPPVRARIKKTQITSTKHQITPFQKNETANAVFSIRRLGV